MTNLGHLSVT